MSIGLLRFRNTAWRSSLPEIVKVQGLCLLASQSNDPDQQQQWKQEEYISTDTVNVIFAPTSGWYDDIRFYLTHEDDHPTLDFKKRRALRLKSTPYQFIDNVLFKRNYDGVFLRCLEKQKMTMHYLNCMQGLQEDTI